MGRRVFVVVLRLAALKCLVDRCDNCWMELVIVVTKETTDSLSFSLAVPLGSK